MHRKALSPTNGILGTPMKKTRRRTKQGAKTPKPRSLRAIRAALDRITLSSTTIEVPVTLSGMSKTSTKAVAYYRVSTDRQGKSGLGLSTQKDSVAAWARSNGVEIIAEFTEVESGKRKDRPKVHEAIGEATLSDATLVVAKLDRLARKVSFLQPLLDADVPLVALDVPGSDRAMFQMMMVFAEMEGRRISARVKENLAKARRNGVKLGADREGHARDFTKAESKRGGKASGAARRASAREYNGKIASVLRGFRENGFSLAKIAAELNRKGKTTRRGCQWTPIQVSRVLQAAV